MAQVIKDVVTWLKQWFYTEDEVDTITGGLQTQINNKADSSTVSSLSTTVSGKAPTNHASTANTYGLGTTSNYGHVKTINDLTTSAHADGLALSAYQGKILNDAIAGKASSSHTHDATEVGISRSYAHIGTESGVSQKDVNDAINIQLGALKNVNLIALVTGDLPTASADTMNKLYVKAKSGGATGDGYDIWVTIKTGTSSNPSYDWEKIDDFDLQTISVAWDSVTNKPSTFPPEAHAHGNILTSGKLSGFRNANIPLITTTDGLITGGSFGSSANTFCEGNDSRLSDARTPTSHAHGNLQDDGQVGETVQASKNVVTDANGKITTENKPTIPSDVSDLTDNNNTAFTPKSHAHGNITTAGKLTNQFNKPLITDGTGLIGAGSFGSTSGTFAEGNHTHSGYENPTIAYNLTTNDATQVLSAKQGKVLNDNKAAKTAALGTTITLVDKGETNEGCIIFNTIS